MSADKINDRACAELTEMIFEVVKDKILSFINQLDSVESQGMPTKQEKRAKKKYWSFKNF